MENNQERLERLVKTMAECTDEELCAAIALLPDYVPNGAALVLAAAAKIVACSFKEEEKYLVLEKFKELVMSERKKDKGND